MPPLFSPARRVLGDKNPNASLQIASPIKSKGGFEADALVSTRPNLKRPSSPTSFLNTSPRAGQKRRLEEISHSTRPESQGSIVSDFPASQMTEVMSDGSSPHGSSPNRSTQVATTTSITTFNSSFHASQEESQKFDQQFVIHDEMSQRALDKMHEVTLPQNTSQLPQFRPSLVTEASQLSLSMSSLIDFEGDEMEVIEEPEFIPDQRPKTQEDTRKEMLVEKAETLRTRLQLAIYKIQSNQISIPFARLQTPKRQSPSPEVPLISSSPRSSSTIRASSVRQTPLTPEARVALARAKATMEAKPSVRPLSSIPVPTILPTAYSARWTDDSANDQPSHDRMQPMTIPSSPPLTQSDDTGLLPPSQDLGPKTPLHVPHGVEYLDSPSDLDTCPNTGQKDSVQNHLLRHGGLTSSVVKGEAANGLLELMRGTVATSGGSGMCGL